MVPVTDYQIVVENSDLNGICLLGLVAVVLIIYNLIMYIGMSLKKKKLESIYKKVKKDKQEIDYNSFWDCD